MNHLSDFHQFYESKKDENKKKYAIGTTVWFTSKDFSGRKLYDGAHKVIDNTGRKYMLKGKDYKVEARHSEITDVKPKK